jgi:hypothetical protein
MERTSQNRMAGFLVNSRRSCLVTGRAVRHSRCPSQSPGRLEDRTLFPPGLAQLLGP